jgi:hypothetical protein
MKPPVEIKIRHVVAQKRAGTVAYAIPRRYHRLIERLINVLPTPEQTVKAIGNGANAIAAVLAVLSMASSAF